MATAIDKGSQVQRIVYAQPLTAKNENQAFYKIIPDGVYSGGLLSENSGNVDVSPLVCFVRDDTPTSNTAIRIETTTTYTLTGEVTEASPYIVLNYEWFDTEVNYMDIRSKTFAELQQEDIILGKATFVGGIIQATFDYSERKQSILSSEAVDFTSGLLTLSNIVDSGEAVIGATIGDGGSLELKDDLGTQGVILRSKQVSNTVAAFVPGGVAVGKSTADSGKNLDVTGVVQIGSSSFDGDNDSFDVNTYLPQDLSTETDPYSGGGSLWEMSGPTFFDNSQIEADFNSSVRNGNSGQGKIFPNRGSFYYDGVYGYTLFPNQLLNEDAIEFYIYPNWGFSPGTTQTIIDTRGGSTDSGDFVLLTYETANTYTLTVQRDSSNNLVVTSATIVTPNQLTHLKIAWSKLGNTAKLIIDGVDQGAPVVLGTGATNIDMSVRSGFSFGSENSLANKAPYNPMNSWVTDLLVYSSYDISDTHRATGKPYVASNRTMGVDTQYWMDALGNFGAKSLWENGRRIIDSGSNALGSYVIFSDGTALATAEEGTTVTTSTLVGSVYQSAEATLAFPIDFSSIPSVMPAVINVSGEVWGVISSPTTLTTASIRLYSYNNTSQGVRKVVAFGDID